MHGSPPENAKGNSQDPGFNFRDFGFSLAAVIAAGAEDGFDAANLLTKRRVEGLWKI